jgi:MIP family channel proteins
MSTNIVNIPVNVESDKSEEKLLTAAAPPKALLDIEKTAAQIFAERISLLFLTILASFYRAIGAEFIGVTLFVFIGTGSAFAATGEAGILGISLAFGFAISVLIYTFGHHSGGHLNPAVTLAFLGLRTMHPIRALCYIVAQLAGSVLGALLIWGSVSSNGTSDLLLKVKNVPGPDVSTGQAFLIETVLTYLLVIVVLETAVNKKTSAGNLAPVAIGWAVFLAHIVAIPFTGCGINPARSFGPAVSP